MRFMTRVAAVAAAGVLGAAIAAPAATAGSSGVDYRGTFDGDIQVQGPCTPAPANDPTDPSAPTGVVTGEWRANVGAKVVSARFVMSIDGVPHVVYTFPMTRVTDVGDDVVFQARGETAAGTLTITLIDEKFTYTIQPYDTTKFFDPGYSCPGGVTFPGELS